MALPSEQLPVFAGKTPLVGEVAVAVFDADFPASKTAYARLGDAYPDDDAVTSFEFLSAIFIRRLVCI